MNVSAWLFRLSVHFAYTGCFSESIRLAENGFLDTGTSQAPHGSRAAISRAGFRCGVLLADVFALVDPSQQGCPSFFIFPHQPRSMERRMVDGSRKRLFESPGGHAWSDCLGRACLP